MERKRLQQQKMKQQQRFCVSQQDLSEAISRMNPQRRATYNNIMTISSSSSSIDTLTVPSVSQLIKEYEARAASTPYISIQDMMPTDKISVSNGTESNCFQQTSVRTKKTKVSNNDDNHISSSNSRLSNNGDQKLQEKIHQDQSIADKEQEISKKEQQDQTSDNDRYRREFLSASFSSYHSVETNHSTTTMMATTRNTTVDITNSIKQHDKRFDEILEKEAQLNNALADLISLSNDADISSSISSSLRSLTNISQRGRRSSTNNTNSISASIALLNNLLETFDLEDEEYKNKTNKKPTTTEQSLPTNDKDAIKPVNMYCLIMSDNSCANCHQSFATNEQIVNAAGKIWHTQCFVCAQCFQPFENGIYFECEGRKFCERDFQMLFAPCCAECKKVIVGRIIRALQKCFHPDCFRCQICHISLLEIGFSKNNGRALCRECHVKEKAKDPNVSQYVCSTCSQVIDTKYIKYKGECFHPYHFRCSLCDIQLDQDAQEVRGLLYCLPCYNKLDLPVCAACRRFIDGRVINALGKQWHAEHFCCARCGQPFRGGKHYENKGLAYCEMDYQFLFGSTCFVCNRTITDAAYAACNKKYCTEHFACSKCDMKMSEKTKYFDVDATPVCKQCYSKLPPDTRKSLQQPQHKKRSSSTWALKQTTV